MEWTRQAGRCSVMCTLRSASRPGTRAAIAGPTLRRPCVTPHVAGKSLTPLCDGRPNSPPLGLRFLAEPAKEDRRALRLGQNRRCDCPDNAARHRKARRVVHHDHGRLQPGEAADVAGEMTMNKEDDCRQAP